MVDRLQQAYLDAMGIDVWVRREHAQCAEVQRDKLAEAPAQPVNSPAQPPPVERMDWEALRFAVRKCVRCDLHRGRTQTVFGVGNTDADWLLIGEAPGAEEDRQGEPFVGRAGKLLNAMLAAVGLSREEVFIANILKCRPPNNRDPRPDEAASCEPYLKRQIELIRPKIILALGRVAAQNLLKIDMPIGRMRGESYKFEELGTPVVVTYHPAYLLRSPKEKRKAWQDLLLAKRIVESA